MKNVEGLGRIRLDYAVNEFIRHCRLRNLSQETQKYYQEDLNLVLIFNAKFYDTAFLRQRFTFPYFCTSSYSPAVRRITPSSMAAG